MLLKMCRIKIFLGLEFELFPLKFHVSVDLEWFHSIIYGVRLLVSIWLLDFFRGLLKDYFHVIFFKELFNTWNQNPHLKVKCDKSNKSNSIFFEDFK